MNPALLSEAAFEHSKRWATPRPLVTQLEALYGKRVGLDAAATRISRVCPEYLGPDHEVAQRRDALQVPWLAPPNTSVWHSGFKDT